MLVAQVLTLSHMRDISIFLAVAISAVAFLSAHTQSSDPEVSPYAGAPGWQETKEERTAWFKDAKFGMFIHWTLV